MADRLIPACSDSAVQVARDVAAGAVDAGAAVAGHVETDGDYVDADAVQAPEAVVHGRADSAIAASSSLSVRRYYPGDGSPMKRCSSPPVDRPSAQDADDAGSVSDSCTPRTLTIYVAAPPIEDSSNPSSWTSVVAVPMLSPTPCPRSSQSPSFCDPAAETEDSAAPLCRDGPSRDRRPSRSSPAETLAAAVARSES